MLKESKPFGLIIIKMMRSTVCNLKKRLQKVELSYSLDQFILLKAVQKEGNAIVQQDIAERMGKDKSYILRIINSLQDENLIKRVVNPADRRKNNLVLTEKGLLLLERFHKIENELLKDLEEGITPGEMNIFFKVIAQIQQNAENT
jgi:MarR family transcriptional regulator for hemolysin